MIQAAFANPPFTDKQEHIVYIFGNVLQLRACLIKETIRPWSAAVNGMVLHALLGTNSKLRLLSSHLP